jgi:hypothetical protein
VTAVAAPESCGGIPCIYTLVLLSAALLAGVPATAEQIDNNVGITDPTQVITFDEFTFPTGTPITNQYASLGATFSPGLCYNVQPIFFPTASLGSFSCSGGAGGGNNAIFFDGPVTGAAVALQSNPETTTFTALLDGVTVDTFSTGTNLSVLPDLTHASDFYGFDNEVFDELLIQNGSGIYQIDNLQFTATPEPGSMFLLASGLLVALAARKRRPRA